MKAAYFPPLLLWLWLASTSALIASSEKLQDVEAGTFGDAYPSLLAAAEGNWGGILSDDVEKETLRDEVWNRLEILGKVSDAPDKLQRTFLSPAMQEAMALLQEWMTDAGMRTWVDIMGNVHGRVDAPNSTAPALLLGSHFDTVIDAGKYDGTLGVITSIAAVKGLLQGGHTASLLKRPIELVAFCDEEGVRFGSTFLGSRAIAGGFNPKILDVTDDTGTTVAAALLEAGLATGLGKLPEQIAELAFKPSEVAGYVEVHIEQGPVLERKGVALGVVPTICGQTRLTVTVQGAQGHAGTVPMALRKDAMAAAAEVYVTIEKICGGGRYGRPEEASGRPVWQGGTGLVGTVGDVRVWPGASNVIPGRVIFSVDIRAPMDDLRETAVKDVTEAIYTICIRRGVKCEVKRKHDAMATQCAPAYVSKLQSAASRAIDIIGGTTGISGLGPGDVPIVVSGAGHDAMAMAKLTQVGILFVRCKAGISHSPEEAVEPDDIWAASLALMLFLQEETLK
ncbi:Allantoate amidohydrolase [Klebsormidium nitens]|uniref:Allantoate amidohydrolase n=1 Tax=Klebsormidium nitens TaxID=105231 RepID=A0A1Y1HXQ6_KLENI|nr:Allantoate amidohydrolase [Klebsormidium nitens]|eukprot:GAQ83425.1 Allantoate amidohydrolase [Klebsormidium nitens]